MYINHSNQALCHNWVQKDFVYILELYSYIVCCRFLEANVLLTPIFSFSAPSSFLSYQMLSLSFSGDAKWGCPLELKSRKFNSNNGVSGHPNFPHLVLLHSLHQLLCICFKVNFPRAMCLLTKLQRISCKLFSEGSYIVYSFI